MKRPIAIFGALLASTALATPAWALPTDAADPAAPAADTAAQTDTAQGESDSPEISAPGGDFGEIVVQGKYIPDVIRSTPQVVSVLSTEDIARTGAGDIAGALTQVTGLSVVGNGYVYVRGLGDRYSLAMLNGLPLPSPEPLKRVVPLDIFPTNIVASAVVQKSYSANYPAEFGGGVINLTTTVIPEESFLSVQTGISGDSETTSRLGYTHYGSSTDWTGYDGGARSIPGPLAKALAKGRPLGIDSLSPNLPLNQRLAEMQEITASLTNAATTLAQTNYDIPVNSSAELSAGLRTVFGDGIGLGIVGSFGFDNSWGTKDAIRQESNDPLLNNLNSDGRQVTTDNHVVVNGLFGAGIEFGEHTVRWTNVYIHDTIKRTKLASGLDTSSDEFNFIKQGTAFYERQLFDTQLVGEFKFETFSVDMRGSYANSKRKAPYERSFLYKYDPSVGDYVNNLSQTGKADISFGDLNEDVYGAGIDLAYRLEGDISATLTAGYAYSDTKRSSIRRDFRFISVDGALDANVAQERPDYLLSDYNIYNYNIVLSESSGQSGAAAYDAGLRVHGAYGMVDLEPMDGLGINIGVRYETAKEYVTPLNLDGTPSTTVTSSALDNSYWLPAATITWNFAEDMQLRLNASKTIARPQFRELANQVYQDIDSDRQFLGNPFLVDSKLFNAEARYEWYFGRNERFTLAGFYKKIDNPIEAFSDQSTGSVRTSFVNAPSAKLFGAEIDVQKNFSLDSMGGLFVDRSLVIVANYTYTKSKLEAGNQPVLSPLLSGLTASQIFEDGAPLTGQSDHLVNLQLGMESNEGLSQQTIIVGYAGKRITSRGPFIGTRQPDFFEKPGLQLDVVLREQMEIAGLPLKFKFQAKNLLGTKHQEYQALGDRRVEIDSYDVGTKLSLSVGLDF